MKKNINSNKIISDYWNQSSDNWYKDSDELIKQIIEKPEIAFPKGVYNIMMKHFKDFRGLKVLVPSSGDNTAVFAFHLLGAYVTSSDISNKQLINAKKISDHNKWEIDYHHGDSMSLDGLQDNYYDLIYTSNGVHVWISDLNMMYKNFNRLLKSGGKYMFFETHPMTRPFDDSGPTVKIVKQYNDCGPFDDDGLMTYHWRTQDYINALLTSDFAIIEMIEFNSSKEDFIKYDYMYNSEKERIEDGYKMYDWHENPFAALPQCIGLMGGKND